MDNRFTDLSARDKRLLSEKFISQWRYEMVYEPVRGRFLERDIILGDALRAVDEHYERHPFMTATAALIWLMVICCICGIVYLFADQIDGLLP